MVKSSLPQKISLGWGERIRFARTEAGLSQDELAQKVPTSRNTISRWEKEHHPVSAATWPALASALGVRAEWLRDGVGPRNPTPVEQWVQSSESANKELNFAEDLWKTAPDDEKDAAMDRLSKAESNMKMAIMAKEVYDWLQLQPDRLEIENWNFYAIYKLRQSREESLEKTSLNNNTADFYSSTMNDDSTKTPEFKFHIEGTPSPSKRLALNVLEGCIRKIVRNIPVLTDDEIAELANKMREYTSRLTNFL